MAEIASVIAIFVALGALFLASQAFHKVGGSFDDFTKQMMKHVSDAQSQFTTETTKIEKRARAVENDVKAIDTTSRDLAEKVSTLTQRVKVLEYELQALTDSIPKQYRRMPVKRDDSSKTG